MQSLTTYRPLDPTGVAAWLNGIPALASTIGDAGHKLKVSEVGDGNLNLVFRVEGSGINLIVKQALPYVRLVGDSWPLPLSRSHFEQLALRHQLKWCEEHVPKVFYYDTTQSAIVMELLKPHIILRKGLIAGIEYPSFSSHISRFLARTLYYGSVLHLSGEEYKSVQAAFAPNHALCKITEDLVFTEPYFRAPLNRWTSPHLDGLVVALQADSTLKMAAQRYKQYFMSHAQALIHGDLHTGSIMVTTTDTRVIDPEFAFVGPIGFDVGALLANLILSWFSQRGHAQGSDTRQRYADWIALQMTEIWQGFSDQFKNLWRDDMERQVPSQALLHNAADRTAFEFEQDRFLRSVFADSLAFAGLKIIRRIVGLAHVEDMESIADAALRAQCEAAAVALARQLVVDAHLVQNIGDVLARMRLVQEAQSC